MSGRADSPLTGWYRRADPGAPDRFVTTCEMQFVWEGCPPWAWLLAALPKGVAGLNGNIISNFFHYKKAIYCFIPAGFHFAVSVAPDFERALPGACPHDWIYANADAIAKAWGCSVWTVLKLGDHWFLAILRKSRFGLRRSFFISVRAGGFFFNRIGRMMRGRAS